MKFLLYASYYLTLTTTCTLSTSGGDDYVDRRECLSNQVTDIARRDINCANMIAKFINATQSYDYDNDYAAAYPGAYFGYVFNAPQDTIDAICTPNCRSELTQVYQQCTANVSVPYS